MKPSIVTLSLVALTALTLAKAGALTTDDPSSAAITQAEAAAPAPSAAVTSPEPPAISPEPEAPAEEAVAQESAAGEAAGLEAPVLGPAAPPPVATPILPELLADIQAEREEIETRRQELDAREARIALAGDAVTRQIADLRALRTELDELLGKTGNNHATDVEQLVKLYRGMKAPQAAAIMNDMDLEVATLVIAAMNPREAGPILAAMNAERAQVISKIMFQRSRLPGDQKVVRIRAE